MRPAKKLLPAAAFCLLLAGSSGAFAAKPANPIEAEREVERAREDFGLRAFLDGAKVWKFLCVIFGAIGLGCVVAFHPLRRRISYDDLDQPKIIITYTVVGALIAIVVAAIPAMGFAVFGIGSVMRFRTELGAVDPARVRESEMEKKPLPSLHSSRFHPLREPTIRTGVLAMTSVILELAK